MSSHSGVTRGLMRIVLLSYCNLYLIMSNGRYYMLGADKEQSGSIRYKLPRNSKIEVE